MKFGTYLEDNQISEWKEFYLNYHYLKSLLKPLIISYKSHLNNLVQKNTVTKINYDLDDRKQLLEEKLLMGEESLEVKKKMSKDETLELQTNFRDQMIREFSKIEFFLDHNFKYFTNRLIKIKEQLEYIKINKQYKIYRDILEEVIKETYKELNLLKVYIELNFKAKTKILKIYKKITKFLEVDKKLNAEEELNKFLEQSQCLNDPFKILAELTSECEKSFYIYFFDKYSISVMKVLKDYIAPVIFTQSQAFYFGFFVGILSIMIILCLLLFKNFDIDIDNDLEFSSLIPMFRSFGIICMYIWILGLNVWAWNSANIDYKLVFNFKNHYSNVISIFKRAAIFSTILVLMVLCYVIIRIQIPILNNFTNLILIEYTPLICWLSLLIYTFFPIKNYFNYLGRIYLFKLFYESFASLLFKIEFRHVWFMDQLTSLVGPMRDMEYTVCYYAYYETPLQFRKQLCTKTRGIVLLIGIFPHLIRISQCIRVIVDSQSVYPQIVNAGKYLFAIIVSIFSFLLVIYPVFHRFWWIFAIVSTIYSSWWDIKYDFGFLQPGANWPLREKLSFKNKYFYYFVFISDVFLRFIWILSVSPEIISSYIHPEFLSLIVYSLEVIRRGMWNFVRVELQHIQLCREFKVTNDVELPFKKVNGSFIIKNINVVDMVRMNKRIDKIKSRKICNLDENYQIMFNDDSKKIKDITSIEDRNDFKKNGTLHVLIS